MNRLGETLSSTHDLPKLLAVVLEAAVQARRAKAGSVLLLTADRTALVREATHGLTQRDPAERIPVGQGVAGTVAATGRAMVLASPAGNGGPDPAATTQVSVPLLTQGRVLGVLSLYDRSDGEPFTLADADALTAFAVQAAVAIENVRLHAEAERLSVTDPLTGTWNYRYFERRFEQEIERSRRFGRVLALLMLDVDHFKSVNDRFGHQRGDEVLVEFAGRVTGSVRDIDTSPATAARSSSSSCPRPTWRAAWPWPRSCDWPPTGPLLRRGGPTAGSASPSPSGSPASPSTRRPRRS
jgi:GAF domain-containing protein